MLMKCHDASTTYLIISLALTLLLWPTIAAGVPGAPHIDALRHETEELFYHGFDSYMRHAFPEDELRPVSCKPLTRDRQNPAHIEVNDVLGNYSLTLVDSLSTLAILASSPESGWRSLLAFQDGVRDLVELYGDGSAGVKGLGKRARGFDLDSKVQVFETVIRGLGGLLSAHLFAVGDLPIQGYRPSIEDVLVARSWDDAQDKVGGIKWKNGFVYNGQLLRLAHDLGIRLLPAFWTTTGIPYPRVNLKYGIPFYANSPGNPRSTQCMKENQDRPEITETCSAGAGSLVLEFTVLGRLTGDPKFEELAKRAFWAVWSRRSSIDLLGAGIDAESGAWQGAWTGIGAGIDSFFEYAYKSHVLLRGQGVMNSTGRFGENDPRSFLGPLPIEENSAEAFLEAWETSHAAIKRHVYRGTNFQHPHYIQVDINTGAPRAFWVDALSAYYPGLLAMSGNVAEAIETHLTSTAIWARFSALPERYNMATGNIEGGLNWWIGRPELVESTWYLYRATEDPFYIYVGEMFLRDIKRRCWVKCGLAGLQNVVTGEKTDRMESFFLGETAKYLFLLFTPDHPLNKLDAPFVMSTEGHPLMIPKYAQGGMKEALPDDHINDRTCVAAPSLLPFTLSHVAARGDVYHAASLARLHLMPQRGQVETALHEYDRAHPSITLADVQSPSNWTYYPWTLPLELVPKKAMSLPMPTAPTFELSFPSVKDAGTPSPPMQRVKGGILVNSLSALRLSMIQDVPQFTGDIYTPSYRIQSINNIALGKDEKLFLAPNSGYKSLNPSDPLFSRTRDAVVLDLIMDMGAIPTTPQTTMVNASIGHGIEVQIPDPDLHDGKMKAAWNSLVAQISDLVRDAHGLVLPMGISDPSTDPLESNGQRVTVPAITPTGKGAAPLPDWPETSMLASEGKDSHMWSRVYAAGDLCDDKIPTGILKRHEIILVRRGNCSFSKKLSNIATVTPNKHAFQLVVIVDYDHTEHGVAFGIGTDMLPVDFITRPLLDQDQISSGGLPRQNLLPMVMVGGGETTYELLRNAQSIGVKRRYSITTQGVPLVNINIL